MNLNQFSAENINANHTSRMDVSTSILIVVQQVLIGKVRKHRELKGIRNITYYFY